jgi:endogenous inhibitor of DNA gyrase (YacG/DUF329 family)
MPKHKPCPICRAIIKDVDFSPFCSKRCADIDLGRWFKGSYAIPAVERPDFAELDDPLKEDDSET